MHFYLYASISTLCIVFNFHEIKSSEILRPRGVSISKASLYNPEKSFVCFDGSATLPFKHINDDYCDCFDGSDEPGTAACPTGKFHCTNAGHKPLNIPSGWVNDGICDCCDASDEYNSTAECINNCYELGKAARVEAQRRAEIQRQGYDTKQELSRKGKEMKKEKHERLAQLEKELYEAEIVKQEKETLKASVEELEGEALKKYQQEIDEAKLNDQEQEKLDREREAQEAFQKLDENQDGKLQLYELQKVTILDMNKDGDVSESEVRSYLNVNEELSWEDYLQMAWPVLKPYFMLKDKTFTPPEDMPLEIDAPEMPEDTTESHEQGEGEIDEEKEEEDEDLEGEEEEERQQEHPEPQYDPETQQLIDEATKARSEFDDAERVVRDLERAIRQVNESLGRDYGPDEEFLPLDGECFEYEDSDYTYKLCPFDQVTQKPKAGGAETRLGTWNKWIESEDNLYSQMHFSGGQSCWNGPARFTHVQLVCGTDNQITSVGEPNRCEYVMTFETPSACWKKPSAEEPHYHEEL